MCIYTYVHIYLYTIAYNYIHMCSLAHLSYMHSGSMQIAPLVWLMHWAMHALCTHMDPCCTASLLGDMYVSYIQQSSSISIDLSINLSIYQSINLSIYQSINLSIYHSSNLLICRPMILDLTTRIRLSLCLVMWLCHHNSSVKLTSLTNYLHTW